MSSPSKNGDKVWLAPQVPHEAPDFCKENDFSQTTCFDCRLPDCFFTTVKEETRRKKKKRRPKKVLVPA